MDRPKITPVGIKIVANLAFFLISTKYLEFFFVKNAFFLTFAGLLCVFVTEKGLFCLSFSAVGKQVLKWGHFLYARTLIIYIEGGTSQK